MTASSRVRSSAETVKDIPVRIPLNRTRPCKWESQIGLLCSTQSTSVGRSIFGASMARAYTVTGRAMGVMLRPEFNKRKEVIQCRVGPWRWWWEADAEPAVSEQFLAEWLHSATRKLRATKTWQPPFRLGRARGLAAPPAQPSQFSRKAAETRPSLRLGNRTIEAPFDPPIAAVGNSTMVRTHAPAGLDVVGRRTIS